MVPAWAAAIGDRHEGVGFDQLVVIRPASDAAAEMEFWNADGSRAGACGNATRCVADLLMRESGAEALRLRVGARVLRAERAGALVRVDMGQPGLGWADVPLARACDTTALPLPGAPGAASMGNPHVVFAVEDVEAVDLSCEGPRFEHDALFPERTNVEFCQILSPDRIRMRVWERGGYITRACGSGACAAVVVLARQGRCARRAEVILDGGTVEIDWRADGVWMTGPVAYVFEGVLDPGLHP